MGHGQQGPAILACVYTPGKRGTVNRFLAVATAALSLAVVWTLTGTSHPVDAASCKSANHQLVLSNGRATPGSGTTTTAITFSVLYRDNAGCSPTLMQLAIPGVGTFPLTPSGSNWTSGVTLSIKIFLPVGTWDYAFTAASGTG